MGGAAGSGGASSGGVAGTAGSGGEPVGGSAGTASGGSAGAAGSGGASSSGSFSVLTYNVAGLPQGISGGNPTVNTPLISPLLNPFDLVYVQEDFSFHAALVSAVTHPHLSLPLSTGGALGDGLNRLARFPFSNFTREAWQVCHGTFDSGSDCLTKKGFSVGSHQLADGVSVDVYNLHMDAGHNSQEDYKARQAQVQQLLAAIQKRSVGLPVIVAGDTNLKDSQDEVMLQVLLDGAGVEGRLPRPRLRGACPHRSHHVPRQRHAHAHAEELARGLNFVDGAAKPLSDHEAVAVDFDWSGKSD